MVNFKKALLTVSVVCSVQAFVYAQGIYHAPSLLPPSPTAGELGKYGLVPISLFSGTPQVEVPIVTLTSKNLNIPISLSYHSTGVKVDEVSGWVGQGWSLNAGGVITRIVRDEPDEFVPSNDAIYPAVVDPSKAATVRYFYHSALIDDLDSERDLYTYNFQGHSGKFVFDREGNLVLLPYSKIKIVKYSSSISNYFIVTTPDGVRYTFDAAERSKTSATQYTKPYAEPAETAWYVTRIEHPQGDVVELKYTPVTYSYESAKTQRVIRTITRGSCGGEASTCPIEMTNAIETTRTTIEGLRLSEVRVKDVGSVAFLCSTDRPDAGFYKLNQILLRDAKNNIVREFAIHYTFPSNNARMFLTALEERGSNGIKEKITKFSYDDINSLPPRLSFSQDHWGFFNGATNVDFVPKNNYTISFNGISAFAGIGGNREVNPLYAKKGMLTKITYPTGGETELAYESNTYYGDKTVYPSPTPISIVADGRESAPPVVKSRTIVAPFTQIIEYSVTVVPGSLAIGCDFSIYNKTRSTHLAGKSIAPGETYTQNIELRQNEEYIFTITARGDIVTGSLSFSYYSSLPTVVKDNIPVGGLRVRSTRDYDPVLARESVVNYYYGRYNDLLKSSGRPFSSQPKYYIEHRTKQACMGAPCAQADCRFGTMQSSNMNTLLEMHGGNIGYQFVSIAKGSDMGAGIEEHEFIINHDEIGAPVWGNPDLSLFPVTNTGWNHGLETNIRYFKKVGTSFTLLKEVFNHYVKDPRKYKEVSSISIRKSFDDNCAVDVVYNCDATNVNAATSVYQCVANHDHNNSAGWPWQSPGCRRKDARFEWVFISQHPCYKQPPGSTVIQPSLSNNLDAVLYRHLSFWIYKDSTSETLYDENGQNPVTTAKRFFYDNPTHGQVSRERIHLSDKKVIILSTKYPDDYNPTTSDALRHLQKSLISAIPVKQETEIAGRQIKGQVIEYNAVGLPLRAYEYYNPQLQTPTGHNPSILVPSSFYEQFAEMHHDPRNWVLTSTKLSTGPDSLLLWGYDNTLPIASIQNGGSVIVVTNGDFSFEVRELISLAQDEKPLHTPFNSSISQTVNPIVTITAQGTAPPPSPDVMLQLLRSDGTVVKSHNCTWGANSVGPITIGAGTYQWRYTSYLNRTSNFAGCDLQISMLVKVPQPVVNAFHSSFEESGVVDVDAQTGGKVLTTTYQVPLPSTTGDYILTYWSKAGTSPWVLNTHRLAVNNGSPASFTIGGTNVKLDEVRVHPTSSFMTTYTYSPLIGVTTITDANNVVTRFEYDNFGRLKVVRDHNRNIVKVINYHYKNSQ